LNYFVGQEGLGRFISMLDPRPQGESVRRTQIKNVYDLAEVMRRLFLVNYEEARQHWQEAIDAGFFEGANEYAVESPQRLRDIVERFSATDATL
jgi:hypothetical protein